MLLKFREVQPGDVEQELTQQDQFNTDNVPLAATLVRESIQNSSDAKLGGNPARVCISFRQSNSNSYPYWRKLLDPLRPHLLACDADFDLGELDKPDFILIEDFETTGLTGEFGRRDDENFNDFWRRVGRSHKAAGKSGSWGLGKLVFPVSSRIRTFFGLTIRHDDIKRPLLMGQTILKTHRVGPTDFVPHGFFARHEPNGFQHPITDNVQISEFIEHIGFLRKGEPGLSIAIPFPRDILSKTDIIPLVIENYFFPILTGALELQVDDVAISAQRFDKVAREHGSGSLADGYLTNFIRQIDSQRSQEPTFNLPEDWTKTGIEAAIPEATLAVLREKYDASELISVKAPLSLHLKSGQRLKGSFDLFLRRASADIPAAALRPLFVRGSITVPNEETNFRGRRAFAALVATEQNVARFLRDAENPAHTSWNGNAEKLTSNWKAGSSRLREIRRSLSQLHQLLDQAVSRVEVDALKALVYLKDSAHDDRPRPDPTVRPPNIPVINSAPRLFEVVKKAGGFVIKAGAGLTSDQLPLQLNVQAAYDLPAGNPFKKYSPYDFNFRLGTELKMHGQGATWTVPASNRVRIDIRRLEFWLEVTGFDGNRDLVVAVTKVTDEETV